MASHVSTIYKNYPLILIYLFVFVLITHAELPRCWTTVSGKTIGYYLLTQKKTARDTTSCITLCEQTLYCEYIYYRVDKPVSPCYIATNTISEDKLVPYTGRNTLMRMDQECLIGKCWAKHAGKLTRGFINTPTEKTLYQCAQKCLYAMERCLHITYIRNNELPCWIDIRRMTNIQWENAEHANSYTVDKQCWATTTRVIPEITKASRQGLPKCWHEMHNVVFKKVDNGYATNFSACIDTCEQTRHCIVISWKEGATWPCWYNKWSIDLWVHTYDAEYDSYAKDADCLLFPEGTCWKKKSGFELNDIAYKSEYSMITCMEACLKDNCTMFTYYHGISYPCYVGTKRGETQPAGKAATNTDSYILDANCLTSVRTTTTITDADPGIVTNPSVETEPEDETSFDNETDIPPTSKVTSDNEYYSGNDSEYEYYDAAASKTFLSLYCCISPLVFLAGTLLNMHALH